MIRNKHSYKHSSISWKMTSNRLIMHSYVVIMLMQNMKSIVFLVIS